MISRKLLFAAALGLASFARLDAATAQVLQTDSAKTPLPQPVSANELDLVTESWGWNTQTQSYIDPITGAQLTTPISFGQYYSPPAFPQFLDGDAITLQGLFKWRGEQIDVVKDARIAPGYFTPTCGFSVELVLKGSTCNVGFGWYNVVPGATVPPSEIHGLVPSDPSYLNCTDENGNPSSDLNGFCPKAWDNRSPRNLHLRVWTRQAFSSGSIQSDPAYRGGQIGFAMIGNLPSQCSQTKYSVYEQNQRNAQGVPWVTTLIYRSTVDAEGVYLAFEGLPMSAADWRKTGVAGSNAVNDGDFNDAVFFVSGVRPPATCATSEQPCRTGQQGACSLGRTNCGAAGDTPVCEPLLRPAAETCDDIDNDCNGMIDDGDGLCPNADTPICFLGSCVGSCATGAFPCPSGLTCATASAKCVEPACLGITCSPGQSCHAGACVSPCDGVLCPSGTVCELGQCVDPCAGVSCPAGHVCDHGACVSSCSCRGCASGLSCGSDGRCTDAACATVSCLSGTVCRLGACVDPCTGVVCPGGSLCSNGVCSAPGGGGTTGAGGSLSFGGALGFGGSTSSGGASSGGASSGGASSGGASSGGASSGAANSGGAGSAAVSSAGASGAQGSASAGSSGMAAASSAGTAGTSQAGATASAAGPKSTSGCSCGVIAANPASRFGWLWLASACTLLSMRRKSRARPQ